MQDLMDEEMARPINGVRRCERKHGLHWHWMNRRKRAGTLVDVWEFHGNDGGRRDGHTAHVKAGIHPVVKHPLVNVPDWFEHREAP